MSNPQRFQFESQPPPPDPMRPIRSSFITVASGIAGSGFANLQGTVVDFVRDYYGNLLSSTRTGYEIAVRHNAGPDY